MKKCNACNINFNTRERYCPLCQNFLIGKTEELFFPENIRLKTNSMILKILLFSSLVMILLFGFFEILLASKIKITLYVSLGLITNYIIFYFNLKNYQNIYRMFGKYGFMIIVLLLIWYFFTKYKVITNYIIPSIAIAELLFNFIVGLILRKNYIIKYSAQILMNIFLLFLPIILVGLDLTTNNIMSYICCLCSVISIISLLIFFFDDIKDELLKIFNI